MLVNPVLTRHSSYLGSLWIIQGAIRYIKGAFPQLATVPNGCLSLSSADAVKIAGYNAWKNASSYTTLLVTQVGVDEPMELSVRYTLVDPERHPESLV